MEEKLPELSEQLKGEEQLLLISPQRTLSFTRSRIHIFIQASS